jgi:hypothetical protein
LAVGAIWVLAGALLYRFLPVELRHGELVKEVQQAVKVLPNAVVIGVCVFAVYLLGIVLTEVGRMTEQIVIGMWNIVPILAVVVVSFVLTLAFLRHVIIATVLIAFLAWLKWRTLSGVQYLDYLSQVLTRGLLSVVRFTSDSWQDLQNAWDPSRAQVDYMVKEETNRILATSAEIRSRLLSRLPVRLLPDAIRATNLQDADFQRELRSMQPPIQQLPLKQAVRRLKSSPEIADVVRVAIDAKIAGNDQARQNFIAKVVNTTRLRTDVRNRVERAHVQLRAQHEGVYNEYDRLRAEGEFRTAIAVPFVALLSTISYLLIHELQITGDSRYLFYVAVGVTGLFMLAAGDGKKSEAANLLYSSVRQQLVVNADTRTYGIEYFPVKFYGVDIDLEPVGLAAGSLRKFVRRVRARFARQ